MKIYNVSKDIMQEFFDNNASNKILHSSEAVIEIKDEIELNARICKVMNVYDALTTKRSYKKAMTPPLKLYS